MCVYVMHVCMHVQLCVCTHIFYQQHHPLLPHAASCHLGQAHVATCQLLQSREGVEKASGVDKRSRVARQLAVGALAAQKPGNLK